MVDYVLECQQCGIVLKKLTPQEWQQVADRPYDFILFCSWCQKGK